MITIALRMTYVEQPIQDIFRLLVLGGVKSTVSGVFEDLKFTEGYKQTETANRADTGKLQFWSQPSEILKLKSSNTNETLGHTPL